MRYYKTSQPVPGKGDAWMYYECTPEDRVRRYLTYIPMTGEIEKVPNPFIKTLQRKELLLPATETEFRQFWPEEEGGADAKPEENREQSRAKSTGSGKHFFPEMTIQEAMQIHPQVGEVFAAFHLGGCSSCGIAEVETIEQVCWGYGVDVDMLLEVLEGLLEDDPKTADATSEG